MLHPDALAQLAELGSRCQRSMLEIGSYIGGSTIALASSTTARLITVEIGGRNSMHEQLPTDNIIADLHRNLSRAELAHRVTVVNNNFRSASCHNSISSILGFEPIDLLFVDILPGEDLALMLYAGFLDPQAFVVLDDYRSSIAAEKARIVSRWVDAAVGGGALSQIGVFGGTWFGQLTGRDAFETLRAIPLALPAIPDSGYCWQAFAGHRLLADGPENPSNSSLLLLEDDRELPRAHSSHDSIRTQGEGRYSHWNDGIWFSASDNTDPTANGRNYAMIVGGRRFELSAPVPIPD